MARDVAASSQAVLRERPQALAPIVAVAPGGSILFLHEVVHEELRAPGAAGAAPAAEAAAGWARVTTRGGVSGFVPGDVRSGVLQVDERRAIGTSDLPGVLVLGGDTELRSSPAAGSRIVARVPAGSSVEVRSRLGDWVLAGWGDDAGWMDVVVSPVSGGAPGHAPPPPIASLQRLPDEAPVDRAQSEAAARAEREQQREAREAERAAEREARRVAADEARAARAAEQARETAAEQAARAAREAEQAAMSETQAAATAPRAESTPRARADADAPAAGTEDAAERRRLEGEERQAAADARRAAAEQARLAREAEQAAQRERREAEVAEARARREQEKAERQARAQAPPAQEPASPPAADPEVLPAPEPTARPSTGQVPAAQDAEAARRQRADEAERRRAAAEEEKRLREEARLAEAEQARLVREAERAAKDSERVAREEQAQREREEAEERMRLAEEAARNRPPAQPVDIPPPVPVVLDAKAPAERKRDPATNPLVRQGLPSGGVGQAPMASPGAVGDAAAFDETSQLDRSVAALHDDRPSALGLSTGETRVGRAPSVYVGEDATPVATSVVSQIVVRVNDEILTNADFERIVDERIEDVQRRTGATPSGAEVQLVRRHVLVRMIEQLVLLEEGKALGLQFDKVYEQAKTRFMKQAGIADDLELVQVLDATGRTWDDFRRDLLRESVPTIVVHNEVYGGITVAEPDIEAHYRMRQEEWAEEGCVRMREIVLQPEPKERTRDFNQRLEQLLKSLEGGADFCEMARRSSRAPSADDCGLLPNCFTRSQLDEKVALVAFRMKPGDVEPITTDWGFHVIRLEEIKPRRIRALAEVRDQIVDRLRAERGAEEMRRYVDRLRESSKVDVAPEYRALLEGPSPRMGSAGQ